MEWIVNGLVDMTVALWLIVGTFNPCTIYIINRLYQGYIC